MRWGWSKNDGNVVLAATDIPCQSFAIDWQGGCEVARKVIIKREDPEKCKRTPGKEQFLKYHYVFSRRFAAYARLTTGA
jgi:hypothetical protein